MTPHIDRPPRLLRTAVTVLCLLVLATAGAALAQGITDDDVRNLNTPTRQSAPEDPGSLGTLARTVGALALVLGLIAIVAWAARRYLPGAGAGAGAGRGDAIRILSTKMLGSRRSLMLIRVRGQTLLLGVTPQSITSLTEIDEVEGEWAQPADAQGRAPSAAFGRRLGRLIEREVGDEDDTENRPS